MGNGLELNGGGGLWQGAFENQGVDWGKLGDFKLKDCGMDCGWIDGLWMDCGLWMVGGGWLRSEGWLGLWGVAWTVD